MTNSAVSVIIDPARLQRRTLELGLEAVEGTRDLSELLGEAFTELRAARLSIAVLQEELQRRDEALAARALVEAGSGPGDGSLCPHREPRVRVAQGVSRGGSEVRVAATALPGLAAPSSRSRSRSGPTR